MPPKPYAHDGILKLCCECKERKPLSEFYSTKRNNGIWYAGKCKPCYLSHYKNYRKSDHGKNVYHNWVNSDSGKKAVEKRMSKWRSSHPEKRKAHSCVSNAIRDNRLTKKSCRICGSVNSEAHHLSYDDPFNVDWLCKPCHVSLHYPQERP
jgi:hypothetical protein